jgi:hypothetical protein
MDCACASVREQTTNLELCQQPTSRSKVSIRLDQSFELLERRTNIGKAHGEQWCVKQRATTRESSTE